MSKPPTAGIVILNWNGLAMTQRCIETLQHQTYKDFTVIVVDNGSNDGSVDWLQGQNHIDLIANGVNQGFAKAINQGIQRAIDVGCQYVVALNNDTEASTDWLKILIEYMDAHPNVGLSQGATMQLHDKKLFDSSGIYLERGFVPRQRGLGKETPELELPAIGPNAAGAVYRTTMLQSVVYKNDYFDGRFFAYVEDVDLALRSLLHGFEFAFVEDAKLYHIGSATGNKIAGKKMYWGARNSVWLVYKNASFGVLRHTWKIIIKSHLANLQFLWREQRHVFRAYLWGITVGVLSLPRFWASRRYNLKNRTLTDEQLLAILVPSNPPLHNPFKRRANLLK